MDALLLPGGRDRVLVLGSEAMRRVAEKAATSAPWLSIDVATGTITETGATWERGAWAWVSPTDDSRPPTTSSPCDEYPYEPVSLVPPPA